MFESYLQILDTIKNGKYSLLVSQLSDKILATIQSDTINPRVKLYFTERSTSGDPFVELVDEPERISQIKKLLNALYHARLALNDIEAVDLRNGARVIADLFSLYRYTVPHIYQACFLITHLEIDVRTLFSQELALINPLWMRLAQYTETLNEETQKYLFELDSHHFIHQAGVVCGIAVDQMKPQDYADYPFLTQFSAVLPGYLQEFSRFIAQLSSPCLEYQPNLDDHQLSILQDEARHLLHALEQVQGSTLVLPFKGSHCIHVVHHTITLSMSIFAELGRLGEFSQEIVRGKLAQLKYELLPALFGFIDKFEMEALLTPGLFSKPLMKQIASFYQILMRHAQRFVDFTTNGKTLITIDDSLFFNARLEYSYARFAEETSDLHLLQQVRKASEKFFSIVSESLPQVKRLSGLPKTTKQRLIKYYHLIQPYVAQVDATLNAAIVRGLVRSESIDLTKIASLRPALHALYDKKTASKIFRIQLNQDMICCLSEAMGEQIIYLCETPCNPFAVDEAKALNNLCTEVLLFDKDAESNYLKNLIDLNTKQALNLYQFYLISCTKLESAQKAYNHFYTLLMSNDVDTALNDRLRHLYVIFQPYLVSGLALYLYNGAQQEVNRFVSPIDQAFVAAFSSPDNAKELFFERARLELKSVDMPLRRLFALASQRLNQRRDLFAHSLSSVIERENEDVLLVVNGIDRTDYLLKHQEYSKVINQLRHFVSKLTLLFNNALNDQLKASKQGLPYPELDDINQMLAQSVQVLNIKRLFNCLYYLEATALEVEKLNDKDNQYNYVYHVLQMATHLQKASCIVQALAGSSFWFEIGTEIQQRILTGLDTISSVHELYYPAPLQHNSVHSVQSASISYVLNLIKVLPEHITAWRGERELDLNRVRELHQHTAKMTSDILRIFNKSDSYFKLFFESAVMYRLLYELKNKLINFATISYSATHENLEAINHQVLTGLMVEVDCCEDWLGLKPGTLTNTMKDIVEVFYQGLLEPLGMSDDKVRTLGSGLVPLEIRLKAAQDRAASAVLEENKLGEHQSTLECFLVHIEKYKKSPLSERKLLGDIVNAWFKRTLPILQDNISHLSPYLSSLLDVRLSLDDFLTVCIEDDEKLNYIENLSTACSSYFQGLQRTQQLKLQTTAEKIDYLRDLKAYQLSLSSQLVECQSRTAWVIPPKLLRVSLANDTAYEKIMLAITQLRQYVDAEMIAARKNRSTFEDIETLEAKSELVRGLEALAREDLPVENRINNLKVLVSDANFKQTMLACHHYRVFTFSWLKQSVLLLIESVGLYTSSHKKCYNQLVKSLESPSTITQGLRFNLFNRPRCYDLPSAPPSPSCPPIG